APLLRAGHPVPRRVGPPSAGLPRGRSVLVGSPAAVDGPARLVGRAVPGRARAAGLTRADRSGTGAARFRAPRRPRPSAKLLTSPDFARPGGSACRLLLCPARAGVTGHGGHSYEDRCADDLCVAG